MDRGFAANLVRFQGYTSEKLNTSGEDLEYLRVGRLNRVQESPFVVHQGKLAVLRPPRLAHTPTPART